MKRIDLIILLRSNGRMVISDLVTSKEVGLESVNSEDWCSCIDGTLTKENYIGSIRKAGFNNIETFYRYSPGSIGETKWH